MSSATQHAPAGAPSAERSFPVIAGSGGTAWRRIPWSIAERAYAAYAARHGTDQSIERIAERGGFSECELDAYAPGWRQETAEVHQLRELVQQLLRERLQLARLAAETPQFDNPLQVYAAKAVRDRVLEEAGR